MNKIRRNVGQGRENKGPLRDANVWNLQFRLVNNFCPVKQDVDVDPAVRDPVLAVEKPSADLLSSSLTICVWG